MLCNDYDFNAYAHSCYSSLSDATQQVNEVICTIKLLHILTFVRAERDNNAKMPALKLLKMICLG